MHPKFSQQPKSRNKLRILTTATRILQQVSNSCNDYTNLCQMFTTNQLSSQAPNSHNEYLNLAKKSQIPYLMQQLKSLNSSNTPPPPPNSRKNSPTFAKIPPRKDPPFLPQSSKILQHPPYSRNNLPILSTILIFSQ